MDLTLADTLFNLGFLCSVQSWLKQRRYKLYINEEVKGLIHTLPSHCHHGIGLTHYRWSPVCLSVCLSIKTAYPWGPAAKSQLLQVLASHSHTHINEWLTGRVSARVVTLHIKLWRLLWLYTPRQRSLCAWKVNTVGCSVAVRTLSLFSSQRSVWKAYCFVNHGVAEQAVPPLQTPPPLLNLQVRIFSCTMVSREQHFLFPERYSVLFAAAERRAEREWQSAWQKARGDAV